MPQRVLAVSAAYVFAVACLWTTTATLAADPSAPPNVIFIMADDLGYGDLGSYGQKQIHTPRLDRMAREGLRFTNFYAGSTVCAPSRCVLMTGLHTGHCYIRGNAKLNLRPADVTAAEVLKPAGYQTGLIGKWGLGHEGSDGVPTRQGFDSFFGYLDQHHAHNYYPTYLIRNEERIKLRNVVPNEDPLGSGVASVRLDYTHDLFAAEALRFLDDNQSRRFFLYLSLTIPHANNEARDRGMEVPDYGEYADKDWPEPRKGHAAMITRMDRDIGALLDRLEKLNIAKNTLVLFTSDNGAHNEGGHRAATSNSSGPLRGTKRDMYEGGIRVPLIARWPGVVPAGRDSEFIGSFVDILPTLADFAGVKPPAGLDGLSFRAALEGRDAAQSQHEALYWEFYEGAGGRAVRMKNWKGVRQPWHGPIQLYDLVTDLGEQHNLAAEHPELVEEIDAIMQREHRHAEEWKVPAPRPRKN